MTSCHLWLSVIYSNYLRLMPSLILLLSYTLSLIAGDDLQWANSKMQAQILLCRESMMFTFGIDTHIFFVLNVGEGGEGEERWEGIWILRIKICLHTHWCIQTYTQVMLNYSVHVLLGILCCMQGLVKPDIVFFGEDLPRRFHTLQLPDFAKCDLLIIMGTSLEVGMTTV